MTTSKKIKNTFTLLASLIVMNITWAATSLPQPPVKDQTIMGSPVIGSPIQRPTTKSCTVSITKDFPFDAFGKISAQAYQAPANCPPPWSKVILEMNGKIDGAQYDRFGFIHLGQAELLRFTTPEPPHHAINWHVEKDVTQYSSLFADKSPQNFIVQLDNATSEKLNGVYRITASLTFFSTDKNFPAKPQPNIIKALASGDKNQPYFSVNSDTQASAQADSSVNLPMNITHAYLEIFATPHDKEEFWYLPGKNVAPYREIQVYIDGKLAGIAWPFPYIYTGGFNPHLWTPIAAIDALNIPPYVIDVTPFAAQLNTPVGTDKNNSHHISIKLNAAPSNWIIDANLLLNTVPTVQKVEGQLTNYQISPSATMSELPNQPSAKDYKNRHIMRTLSFTGFVKTPDGVVTTTIEQNFSLTNMFPGKTTPLGKMISQDHLMGQQVESKITTQHDKDSQVVATNTGYTFWISPNVDNMDADIPAPFVISQTLRNTEQTFLNGISKSAAALYEKIDSNNKPQLIDGATQNDYKGFATTLYQDLTGRCFYQHLQSAKNQLTVNITHEKHENPNKNLDFINNITSTCD